MCSSDLIKHFIKEQQPDDIVTYIDKEWSEGNGFKRLGFRLIEQTPPQYFYVDPNSFERHYARNQDTDIKVSNCGNYKLMLDLKNG